MHKLYYTEHPFEICILCEEFIYTYTVVGQTDLYAMSWHVTVHTTRMFGIQVAALAVIILTNIWQRIHMRATVAWIMVSKYYQN